MKNFSSNSDNFYRDNFFYKNFLLKHKEFIITITMVKITTFEIMF